MTYKNFLKSIDKKDATVLFNESLTRHTSFGIGGTAKYFVTVNNPTTLKKVSERAKEYIILGAGTNILFRDKRHKKTVVKLGKNFNKIKILQENEDSIIIEVGAAVNLFVLNSFLKKNGIGGLEWSFGIPGCIGGAVVMNAGAFKNEFGNHIIAVKILENKKIFWTKRFSYSYRSSSFKDSESIVLGVKLKLTKRSPGEIESLQRSYLTLRKETQPYGSKCAGSVFKRISLCDEIYYPAKIIDDLGLKGVRIGEAEISKKHAGFIINTGNAHANDVIKLIKFIKKKVKLKTGKDLEEEIIII